MVPKIPSDPHRSHGIPQLKFLLILCMARYGGMVGSGWVDVDFEQDVECGE